MKKVLFYSLISLFISLNSCKKEKAESTEKKEISSHYIVDAKNSTVNWTAYKTSDKVPVKGVFTEVNIIKSADAHNQIDVLNGLEFEIPVTSIFSKDTIRDGKLNKFFFEAMKNTLKLKGTFSIEEDGKGKISLTMNGLTKDLSIDYSIQGENIEINAIMNVDTWEAQAALTTLNKACNELHSGADGVSKTWNEVAINAQIKTVLKK